MSDEPKPKKKMTNVSYPSRVPVYDTKRGLELWQRIARRRGVSVTALARLLIREEAARIGLPNPENGEGEK